jgi:hypothetical protein
MSEATAVQAPVQEQVKTTRYNVSRKGMGGRKAKYSEELLNELIREKLEKGLSVKANCALRGLPYVSVNAALKRLGITNPHKVKAVGPVVATQTLATV